MIITNYDPFMCAQNIDVWRSKYKQVDKYLIRGPHPSIKDLVQLRVNGVNQIYDFRHLSNLGCKFIEKYFAKAIGIKYNRIPYSNLYGQYPDVRVFEEVASNVRQNGEKGGLTLFHCNSGRHRTSHFSAFYKLTGGDQLKVAKKRLNGNFQNEVEKILQEQIIDADYFSRKKLKYVGKNPFKRILISYNNKICEGLENAQSSFISMLKGK